MRRLASGALLAILLAATGAAFPGLASAQRARQADELADIERRLADRAREELRLKDEAKAREAEVEALRQRMIETASALQTAESRIASIATEIARIEQEEAGIATALTAQRNDLGAILGALQSLERSRPPAILVSPEDSAKAARTAMLLADAAPALEAKAKALRLDLDRLQTLRDAKAAERAREEKTNREISARRGVLADLLKKKQKERDVAARLATAAQSETAALAARATTLRDVVQRLERLAREISPRLKPPPKAPATPDSVESSARPAPPRRVPTIAAFAPSRAFTASKGTLRAPVVGRLIGGFGAARPEGGRFEGVRLATADQAIVTAPHEASVAFAQAWNPIGNLLVLDVGSGYHITLLGVGSFLVQEGQRVAAGEPIAVMTGVNAQLDLEIRKDGEPVNPSVWFSKSAGEDTPS